jgi:hypothetical protein
MESRVRGAPKRQPERTSAGVRVHLKLVNSGERAKASEPSRTEWGEGAPRVSESRVESPRNLVDSGERAKASEPSRTEWGI